MAAIDYWMQAAKRPSCLMAVTPYRGGTWASMLKSGVAWPSETPRNFATEPATWYDLGAASVVDLADWEVGGEFYTAEVDAGESILYRGTAPRFGLYVQTANQIRFFNYSSSGGVERIFDYKDYPRNTWVKWSMQRSGGWLRWVINHVEVKAIDKTGLYLPMTSATSLNSNADCLQRNLYFKNLTTGKTIWSYPTWAEDKRLLTFTNVRTDRGVLEAADTSLGWSIKTQLTGTAGTVIERRPSGVYVNSGKFNASTGIYTGLAADQLLTLLAFDYTLTAAEIAAFK